MNQDIDSGIRQLKKGVVNPALYVNSQTLGN